MPLPLLLKKCFAAGGSFFHNYGNTSGELDPCFGCFVISLEYKLFGIGVLNAYTNIIILKLNAISYEY